LENICHWLTVMAPAQVIETKDLPPELLGQVGGLTAHSLVEAAPLSAPMSAPFAEPAERRPEPVAAWEAPVSGLGGLGAQPVEATWSPAGTAATASHAELAPVTAGLPATVPLVPVNGSADGAVATPTWLKDLERDARARLESGQPEVWDALTRIFEASLIQTALELTRGRRIEAAQKLGIGRNTITRKIQELGIDD